MAGSRGARALKCALLVSTLGAGLSVSTTAVAQSAPGQGAEVGLEEIIVSARFRREELQSVPVSVSAFNAASIEQVIPETITDFQKYLPNVQMSDVNFSGNTLAISIRGISFADLEKTFENAITVSIDGVYLGTNTGAAVEALDLDSLEVLRGPQGTLQGRNSIGGAINIRRSRPTGELGLKSSFKYSSYDNLNAGIVFNLPKIGDVISLKGSAFYKAGSAHSFNRTLNRRDDGADYFQGGIAALFEPTGSDWSALFTFDYMKDRSNFAPPINLTTGNLTATQRAIIQGAIPASAALAPGLPAGTTRLFATFGGAFAAAGIPAGTLCDAVLVAYNSDAACASSSGDVSRASNYTLSFAPVPFKNFMDQTALSLEINGKLGNADFTSVTGYRASDELLLEENTGAGPIPVPGLGPLVPLFLAGRDTSYQQFSQELRLNYNFGERLALTSGVFYMYTKYGLDNGARTIAGQPSQAILFNFFSANAGTAGQKLNAMAIYTEGVFNLTDTVRLTGGLRYTHERKQFDINITSGTPFTFSGAQSWGEPTWRAILDWKPTEELMLYGSYSRGYRSGGWNGRAASLSAARRSYDPETVDSFEVGMKSSWFDNRLRFNPAAFYSEYKSVQQDIITATPTGGTETVVENGGEARIYGFELEAQARPIDNLNLRASVGYLNAKYTKFIIRVPGPTPGSLVDFDDKANRAWRRAPDWTFSAGANYSVPIGIGELIADANISYIDEYATSPLRDPLNRQTIASQTKADFSLTYAVSPDASILKNLRLTGYVKDAFREGGRLNTTLNAGLFYFGVQVPARTFGLELSADF
jgi:iron complex outermembrane recepter protein